MTTRDDRKAGLERLQAVLDVNGGDRDRWPAAERIEMSRLIAADEEAARLFDEARALDRLLDRAPVLNDERLQALSSRILDAAAVEGRWQGEAGAQARGGDPASTPATQDIQNARGELYGAPPVPAVAAARPAPRPVPARGALQTAALMALSLFTGVLAGATVLSGDVTPAAVALADLGEETVLSELVTGGDTLDTIEEDLL